MYDFNANLNVDPYESFTFIDLYTFIGYPFNYEDYKYKKMITVQRFHKSICIA